MRAGQYLTNPAARERSWAAFLISVPGAANGRAIPELLRAPCRALCQPPDAPTGHRLSRFLHALPAGARILELGCGNGMDAARMLQLGFDTDATDGTPEMVAEARKRIDHRARLLRFEDIDAEAAYDGVWASASLLHVPAQDLPDILGRIHRALRPGGLFVASYKASHGEGRDHLGRYYNYPTIDGLERAYRVAGWIDPHLEAVMGSGFDALPTQWLWVTGRRPPA